MLEIALLGVAEHQCDLGEWDSGNRLTSFMQITSAPAKPYKVMKPVDVKEWSHRLQLEVHESAVYGR